MSILYLLIPLAVGLMVIAIAFFLWSVRTGQYDDLDGPAYRVLMDDDVPKSDDPEVAGERRSEGLETRLLTKSRDSRSSDGEQ